MKTRLPLTWTTLFHFGTLDFGTTQQAHPLTHPSTYPLAGKVARIARRLVSSPATSKPIRPGAQINQRGLGLLRSFESIPSYAEQSLREIERIVLRQVRVPLTSNQFSALVSLTYNLGEATLKRSLLLKHLNAGQYQAAANQFDCWVYADARYSPELVARRRAERRLFLRRRS